MRRLLFLRHGETALQSSIRYWGRTDVPLSELGRSQARAAARILEGVPVTDLVTSTMSRSLECGRLALCERPVERHVIATLDEIDFGDWEGLTVSEIEQRDPERYRAWREAGGDFQFPGGESRASFCERIRQAFTLLSPPSERVFGECVLFALHRGVIRHLLQCFLGVDGPYDMDLGALSEVRREGDRFELIEFNRTDFLSG
jgi:broad specificity phosphatase PhoE